MSSIVDYDYWEMEDRKAKNELDGWVTPPVMEKGYQHIHTDEFVTEEDAYLYAFEKCMGEDHEKFKEMLVEWYFSGNWVEAEREF